MKKQMLNEGEIRKMMRFADIQGLTENFLADKLEETEEMAEELDENETNLEEDEQLEESETVDEQEANIQEEADVQEEGTLSEMPEEEVADMDYEEGEMEGEEEMADEMAEATPEHVELAKELTAGIADLLSKVLNVDVEAEDAEMDLEGEEEPAVDMDYEEEPAVDMGLEDEEEPAGRDMYQEDLVNEITRRVAKRLMKLSKK
tara:strand:- start:3879 stop:4490 length:612 start_codon:yes stop_codon:yes gene_type:complete